MKKIVIVIALLLLFLTALSAWGWKTLLSYTEKLPSTSSLVQYRPNLITRIYDRHGKLIDELFIERRTLVPLSDIPVDLQNAILAIEDTNFFNHWGMDITGIIRAFVENMRAGRVVQGGSTITQQLAKVMFLTPRRTIKRKIKELLLAMHIEMEFSKEEILQFYLNQIYFGEGAHGIESAAKIYFNKSVRDLNLAESALLAGLPKAPNAYSPENNIVRAYKRRSIVLRRMRQIGIITREAELSAASEPLPIRTYEKERRAAAYFVEHVRKNLRPKFGSTKLYKGGLRIFTTLDLNMQKIADEVLVTALENLDERRKKELIEEIMEDENLTTPDEVELSTSVFRKVQGAIVAIDPRTGQILTMVGGRCFEKSEFNRVDQAMRQPGSAFKPFIFAAAIDNGFTPATILYDFPRVYYNDGASWRLLSNVTNFYQLNINMDELEDEKRIEVRERLWSPQNYCRKFRGNITLRDALIMSKNVATVDLIDRIRPITARHYARKMGISSALVPTLSLALGTSEVTPLELTAAYGVFANQGVRTIPYYIIRIEDYAGNIIYENFPEEKQVLSPQTNYIMVNLMQQICDYGTGWQTRRLKRPRAGKTGTTNNFSDAWFVGFTPNIVATVWVGHDDRSTLGDRKAGGVVAAPIWTNFMKEALAHTPVLDFPVPPNIVFVNFDTDTGKLATRQSENVVLQPFIKGTEPADFF